MIKKTKLYLTTSLFLIFGICSALASERIFVPDDVYYFRFASSVNSLEATWINPAALGLSHNIKVQYIGEMGVGALNKNWGYNLVGDGVGLAYRSMDNFMGEEYNEYIFGAGAGVGYKTYWGFSYRYIKSGPSIYNRRHFWNLGILYRPGNNYKIGIVFSNLNRGRVNGERTDFEQLYSLSYKPARSKITFSIDIALSSGQNLSKAGYNYGVEINAYRGLDIYGNIRDDNSFEIGFVLNLMKYFVGGQTRFDNNGIYRSTPVFVGYNTGLQHSFIP